MIHSRLYRQSQNLRLVSRFMSAPSTSTSHFPPIRLSSQFFKQLASRPYSTATETTSTSPSSDLPPSASQAQDVAEPEDPTKTELEVKGREIIDLKDKYLRSVADFRNLQDRTKREVENAKSFAISRFARDLVESIDNLDRAISTVDTAALSGADNEPNKALNDLYQGLKMTESILMQTLEKHGLTRFDPSPEGEKFDPNMHEATFQTKMEGKEDGTCFDTIQKGFTLNGRILRAAKVGVVKNS